MEPVEHWLEEPDDEVGVAWAGPLSVSVESSVAVGVTVGSPLVGEPPMVTVVYSVVPSQSELLLGVTAVALALSVVAGSLDEPPWP